MKTRQVIVLMIGMSFMSGASGQEVERSIPNLDQVIEIAPGSPHTRWLASFYSDGSAELKYGTGESPQGTAPAGTFSFKEVYDLLAPYLKPVNQEVGDKMGRTFMIIGIGLRIGDEEVSQRWCLYPEDIEIFRTLMNMLRDKVVPHNNIFANNKQAFEDALKKYPLVRKYPIDYDAFVHGLITEEEMYIRDEPRLDIRSEEDAQRIREQMQAAADKEQEKGRAKASPPSRKEKSGIEDHASDGSPGTASPYLYVGILSALCAGAVIWFIRKRR